MHRFAFKAYRRRALAPLSNARERFDGREGLLLRVEDTDGRVGFGECAPLLAFGTESFPAAVAAVSAIGERFEWEALQAQLKGYPCLQWGLESALELASREGEPWPGPSEPWPVCRLLPDGQDAAAVDEALDAGYRCLKAKIGKDPFAVERRMVERLAERCEGRALLRLDANASLSRAAAREWLEFLAEMPVEFLEQPMAVGAEREMQRLAADYPTPLALDESVCQVDQLKRWRDQQWPGIYVLKASLSGSRAALRAELAQGSCDCVYSSSLETRVGAVAALSLAVERPGQGRALGFGVAGLFAGDKVDLELGAFLPRSALSPIASLQDLWNRI